MKLPTFSEIKNAISVEEFYCGLQGLEISYTINGEEKTLALPAEQSAPLLKRVGLIEDHNGSNVTVEMEVCGTDRTLEISWPEFIWGWDGLSQADAITICAIQEDHAQIEQWAGNMRSIPALIETMGGVR